MSISFEGQVALITGAGGGLGRAYALDLAKRGAKVVVNDLGGDTKGEGESLAPAQTVVDEIKAAGGEAVANYDSVASYDGGSNIVKTAVDNYGRLDVVICNAGIQRDLALHNLSEADWDLVLGVHLKGTFTVLRAAWPVFRQQAYGRVVLTSSGSGVWGMFGRSNYAAAKTGLLGLMNTLKHEGLKYNVTVNTLMPVAYTRMRSLAPDPEMEAAMRPELVVPLVTYLVSKENTDTGMILEAGAGVFSRSAIVKGPGIRVEPSDRPSAEFVQQHWAEITSLEGAEPQWRPGLSLREYAASRNPG